MDPRVTRLAKLLLNYSLRLKKGQLLKIQGEIATLPLIKAAYEEAVRIGAHPYTDIIVPDNREILLKHGSDNQLGYVTPMSKVEVNRIDALLAIWGSENTRYLSGVKPRRQVLMQRARKPYLTKLFKRSAEGSLRWVGTLYPTLADAQQAELSLTDFAEFVYRAGHLQAADPAKHWKKVQKEQTRLGRILDRVDRIHVRTSGTDLKLRAKGRKWISCHGTQNFPDGEIFTSPIEDSAEGRVRFSYPSVYAGREVEGVELEFRRGRVVRESADKNLRYLTEMLNMDTGSRRLGEFAVGTNYDIKRFSKNTLFDEKIGGTFHMALGASIPEARGKNKSALHWDMVCDLKKGGEIIADGKVIYRNGKFTI
ncbi:MAG TPA: aminopeptidase [Acidobacteriota bacterium]|nr:aminopeptidase [Acidobacteriota bacterium]